ncbi:hypothetical protein GWI33_011378 [Rhynchophorus ferrugineus]|uniref:Groucho/TLE N-terminal Q-rich domain-containing protein n=1 Tax=Rhynchophorus ferrugineus TaxID=354439 RepID=A0A834IWM1_RHYFE|nr:hypothetical protein GWI33_011378 [Rhynchophorus ferrugineus]
MGNILRINIDYAVALCEHKPNRFLYVDEQHDMLDFLFYSESAGPPQPGQPFKFTVGESCDRIKEEFNFLQAQYHSLKLECEKLASEKIEIQRHYVMYYEMSYGLNVEMHKQTEIAKRLNAIIAQILPFLSQEHQQQVATAVERAKQVTMTELNAIIGEIIRNGCSSRKQTANIDNRETRETRDGESTNTSDAAHPRKPRFRIQSARPKLVLSPACTHPSPTHHYPQEPGANVG